ncbi:Cholinergic receptor [Mactra antiquata]
MYVKVFFCLFLCTGTYIQCFILDGLYHSIFDNYHSQIRPLCTDGNTTNIVIDFALRQIIDLDEPRQILSSIIWIRTEWKDCRISWNVSEHYDTKEIVLPQHIVWVPDLTLYDNSAASKLAGIEDYNLAVYNTGRIQFNFPSLIRSVCGVDVTHFPFDYQTCNLTFGSWVYDGNQVDFFNKSSLVDKSSYIVNTEWHVYDIPVTREVTYYNGDPYTTLTIQLLLQRRPLFYALNLLFPCFLISSVAILGFLLPPASGEKVSLEITVLLSLAVFQLIVLELMPPSGKVSFMGLYFIISMVLVGFSCLSTVIVLNIHFKGYDVRPLPRWVRIYIFRPLTRLMCVDVESQRNRQYSLYLRRRTSSVLENGQVVENGPNLHRNFPDSICTRRLSRADSVKAGNDIELHSTLDQNGTTLGNTRGENITVSRRVVMVMQKICDRLDSINKHLEEESANFNAGFECRTLALALDRLFMTLYMVFITCSCTALSIHFIALSDVPDSWYGDGV